MKKYLQQTEWLLNPEPNSRKRGRRKNQSFDQGTRWIYDDKSGTLTGDGMKIEGPFADTIRAICKEVEPGFGAIVNDMNYMDAIGRLIDDGKLTVADLQNALKEDDDEDEQDQEEEEEEEEDNEDDSEFMKNFLRNELDRKTYEYRHWLSLDPPSEELIKNVAEQERQDAIMREYNQRTQRNQSSGE